jgi:NADH:ubiquinone oxidoreductase subunit C
MIEKSLISGIFYFINRKSLHKYGKIKMTQEINYNLRLIDMMEWSGVQDDFKLELCKNFRTEEMEYYLKIISLDFLNEIMSQIPNSSDDNGIKEIPFCAAINKMESLKVLANLNQNLLEENNRAKVEVRIKNIKEDLSSIKSITK